MKLAVGLLVLMVGATGARASTIFTPGNNPSNDTNILLNSGMTGTTVTGTANGVTGFTMVFSSSQTLMEPSSGQARVSANPEGTPLTNLTISLANNATFEDLIINPFIGGQCPTCTGGAATITVTSRAPNGTLETPVVFTGLTVGTNGNNFLTIVDTNGESIVSVMLNVPGGFNDLRQPRISGPFANALSSVPEPGSLSLLATGLVGLAGALRRKVFSH